MEVNSTQPQVPAEKNQNGVKQFFADIARGVAIGIAFIIPGFSGGSVAAILGVYERLVGAIADFFKHFKSSIKTLLPIAIGMIVGVAALIFPIQWGLSHAPIPTVSLFVGLALGGLPSVTDKCGGGKPSWKHFLALFIPLGLAAGLGFLPVGKEVDLFSLNAGGYFLLLFIGIIGSSALVIPGISGSMLLLIFGYYDPIVNMVTGSLLKGQQVGTCILVLGTLAVGIVAGFFAISVLMKFLLKKFPRGTYFAILGFIVGSIPAVYLSTVHKYSELSGLYVHAWYWIVSAVLLLVGIALSLILVWFAKYRQVKKSEQKAEQKTEE